MHRVCVQLILGTAVLVGLGVAHAQDGRITFHGAVVVPTANWSAPTPTPVNSHFDVRQERVTLAAAASQSELMAYALRRDPQALWQMVTLTYE